MLKERDSLWVKILMTKYNNKVPSNASSWWKDINYLCFEGDEGVWMEGGLCRKVGEDNEVDFWHDNWLGLGRLKDKFGRLFNLSVHQSIIAREMGRWSNGLWVSDLPWRRPFLSREIGMVEELMNIVSTHSLTEGSPDDWIWNREEGGAYSVKSAYVMLQGEVLEPLDKIYNKLWSIRAPSNVFA